MTLRTSPTPSLKEGTPEAGGGERIRKGEESSGSGLGGVKKKARVSGGFGAGVDDEESYRLIREMQAQDLGLRRRK